MKLIILFCISLILISGCAGNEYFEESEYNGEIKPIDPWKLGEWKCVQYRLLDANEFIISEQYRPDEWCIKHIWVKT